MTDDSGNITTYSWGNNGLIGDWVKNADEDRIAANMALDLGLAWKAGDASLDPYVDKGYEEVKKGDRHLNALIMNHCKEESWKLIDKAKQLKEKDDKSKAKDKKKDKTKRTVDNDPDCSECLPHRVGGEATVRNGQMSAGGL